MRCRCGRTCGNGRNKHWRERTAAEPQAGREWGFYVIADLKTWATNAEQQSPIEHFATFEEAKARFDELRGQPYNKKPRT